MEKYENEKVITLEDKRVILKKAPATVAFDVALRYSTSFQKMDTKEMQDCLYILLRYAEIDLGDGRKVALDNKEIINQHFTSPKSLMTLQSEIVKLNIGFLDNDVASGS